MEISIENDAIVLSELDAFPDRLQRALIRAMNRSVKSGRTTIGRLISSDTSLPYRAVLDALPVREAVLNRPEAVLSASLKRIPLIDFNAKGPEPSGGKGRGVSARVGGGVKRYETFFITTLDSGHRGVFERIGQERKSTGAWSKNLPIQEKFGPSIGHVFRKHRAAGVTRMLDVFEQNFDHEVGWEKRKVAAADEGGD